MAGWEATEPLELVDLDVPPVRHRRCDTLDEAEKRDDLESAALDFLAS
jgi:hypothetical protein